MLIIFCTPQSATDLTCSLTESEYFFILILILGDIQEMDHSNQTEDNQEFVENLYLLQIKHYFF